LQKSKFSAYDEEEGIIKSLRLHMDENKALKGKLREVLGI
jgi:hypothetical protein